MAALGGMAARGQMFAALGVAMEMRADLPVEGFLRHRGLIAAAAGGAVAETLLLTLVAPGARPVAPQVTTLPPLAAYHDLRWLFSWNQSWLGFAATLVAVLAARAAVDAGLLRLAWPRHRTPPRASTAFWSCAGLTALVWLLLSPVVTLTFGVAVLPFSWPFLAALPLLVGVALALSHGGATGSWWRRFPPLRTAVWLLGCFLALSLAGALIARLELFAALGVAAVAGVLNARAWYGLAWVAARQPASADAAQRVHPQLQLPFVRALLRPVSWFPVAPLCALLVVVLVVGVARLMFTGTIKVTRPAQSAAAAADVGSGRHTDQSPGKQVDRKPLDRATIVVGGFGSTCCSNEAGLRAVLPDVTVRQFSYLGMTPAGQPLPHGGSAGNLPLPVLGDRMAAQVRWLSDHAHSRVDIVAESEGTLGVYAMLARHPDLPVGSVVLLSPIVEPGQLGPLVADHAVPGAALTELDHLIGTMSPYGPEGAQQLLSSVSEYGARYFADVTRHEHIRWMAVIPLADAVTLPVCNLPPTVAVVPAFHGGLFGNPSVQGTIAGFFSGQPARALDDAEGSLKYAAEALSGATIAWRMPVTQPACS